MHSHGVTEKIPPREKKRTTIYSLAQEFGVSPGTVSRALRNRPEISAETRRIIRQRASEIGFKLRNFETRVTNICVVIETRPGQQSLFSTFVDSVLDGVWKYCGEKGLELSLYGEDEERLSTCDLVRVLGRRGVNGAVFLNASTTSRYFTALNQQNFPYCCVMNAPAEAKDWTISSDGENLAFKATEHLLHLGHRRIAYLDSLVGWQIGEARKRGYERALQKAGIAPEREWVVSSKDSGVGALDDFEFASQAVRTLTQRAVPPTAFLTMSDEAGVAALHELRARGWDVPGRASVISFDESRLCSFVSPPLTVVSVPYERLGREAAAIVHRRLDENISRHVGNPLLVSGDLIVRGSTGPVPLEIL